MAAAYSSPSSFSAYFQVILVLPLLCLFLAQVDAGSMNRSEEVNALLKFSQQFGSLYSDNLNVHWLDSDYSDYPPNGYWLTWSKSDETACAWIGVSCTTNYTVDELHFSAWGVVLGDLTPLYALRDLRVLDISFNDFVGSVLLGEICGNLTGLTWLDLSGTILIAHALSGISACRNLRVLAVEHSFLAVEIVLPSMSDLVNLQILNLADNNFFGPFPKVELGDLSNLISLDLSRNRFNGTIPALPNLTRLVELKLDNNYFTGFEDPWSLGTKVLHELSVSNNLLEGMIPLSITNFPNLQFLNMSNNSLSGNIPSGYLGRQRNFSLSLDLSLNQLSGEIPHDLLSVYSSDHLNFSYNLLTGNIPYAGSSTSFCFQALDLSHNNLSGTIPWSNLFGNISSYLRVVRVEHNHLSGDIVDALLGSAVLRTSELGVKSNLFTGDLSRIANAPAGFFTYVPSIEVLDLSDNRLQWSVSEAFPDPIMATLQVFTKAWLLTEFRVGGNNFSGTSFPTACGVNNTFSEGFNLALTILDLSNSHLEGEILGEAFNHTCLGSIQLLNLSNNHATGPLPTNLFAQFDQLFVVDVSNNSLSGPLPIILPSSNLYNPKYFVGNDGLCGGPLPPCPQLLPKQGTGVQWWVLLITIGGSVAIAMGSCSAATWRWRVYKKRHQQDADLIRTLLERDSASLMRLRDLKKATDNFAESAQIGEGGFGTVYMGKLIDGTIVAIKRRKREGSERDKEQFLNEVRILSQVNHRHLAKLLGCCMENKIAVLVFEFVSNGTLQEHLQGKIETGNLSWRQRLKIAVQTADALDYLHSAAALPIIHRDVKSANILLNENLDAKVADFGISRLAPLRATHVSTAAIQGTMGYMDPEYYTSFQLTAKSDVYSFGVVLLELISAKPGLDFCRGGDETSLVNLARPYIERGDLEPFIDPVLTETYRDPTHPGRESIRNVGRLAMKCLSMQSKFRPSMKQVLKDLQNFSLQFSGTTENMDSIEEDVTEDLECDDIILSNSFSRNSSTFTTKTDDGIEMSQSSLFGRFRARSTA